jgi:hypothetical protein
VAEFPDASVAVMVSPPRENVEGIVTLIENEPTLFVVAVPTEVDPRVSVTVELAAKPVPLTVSAEPGAPDVGVTTMYALTTKDLVTELVPSVATMLEEPAGVLAIKKLPVKPPVLLDVAVTTVFPLKVTVIVWVGRKLLPTTVTVAPSR